MRRLSFIAVSVIFMALYLNLDHVQGAFGREIMNVSLLSMEEIESLCEGKEEAFMEPCVMLSDAAIAYDSDNNMLLIPQSLREEIFQGILSVPDGKLYFLEDDSFVDKADAIGRNQVFRLFWITDTQCWMYNVYFTGMPVICLSTEEEENGESRGTVWVYDPYRTGGSYPDMECTWHIRGNTTSQYEKASYRLTLTEKKVSFLGMRRDDDWILHSLYDDDGLIHNKLSYEVWQRIAGSNQVDNDEGIGMEYVELFLDDQYRGIYGLSERIDKKELALNNGDVLYKWREIGSPGADDFYEELTDEMNPHFILKYPSVHVSQDWEPLMQWTSLFLHDEFTDYGAGISLLNMENAIDYNLFIMVSGADDNMMKNVYLWADYQQDGSYRIIKIPWDLNMTWGNSWIDEYACHFNKYQHKNLESTWSWAPDIYKLYLYDPTGMGERIQSRYLELRENIITKESLTEIVDMQYQYLHASGACIRNAWIWPVECDYWSDEYIYEYIDKRIDFLDEYIGQMGR